MNLFPWFLFAHVLGAIIAFGASYSAFPLIGAMSGKEPAHGNFGARISHAISTKVVRPLAILQGITGVAMIWLAQIDLTKALWLDVAIVLYLIALGYALFVQIPLSQRLVELTSGGPPSAQPGPGPAAGAPSASSGPPAGPPPGLIEAATKARRGGAFIGIMITVIVFLMVVKPF
jgi:uncharacterized membrane protein